MGLVEPMKDASGMVRWKRDQEELESRADQAVREVSRAEDLLYEHFAPLVRLVGRGAEQVQLASFLAGKLVEENLVPSGAAAWPAAAECGRLIYEASEKLVEAHRKVARVAQLEVQRQRGDRDREFGHIGPPGPPADLPDRIESGRLDSDGLRLAVHLAQRGRAADDRQVRVYVAPGMEGVSSEIELPVGVVVPFVGDPRLDLGRWYVAHEPLYRPIEVEEEDVKKAEADHAESVRR